MGPIPSREEGVWAYTRADMAGDKEMLTFVHIGALDWFACKSTRATHLGPGVDGVDVVEHGEEEGEHCCCAHHATCISVSALAFHGQPAAPRAAQLSARCHAHTDRHGLQRHAVLSARIALRNRAFTQIGSRHEPPHRHALGHVLPRVARARSQARAARSAPQRPCSHLLCYFGPDGTS